MSFTSYNGGVVLTDSSESMKKQQIPDCVISYWSLVWKCTLPSPYQKHSTHVEASIAPSSCRWAPTDSSSVDTSYQNRFASFLMGQMWFGSRFQELSSLDGLGGYRPYLKLVASSLWSFYPMCFYYNREWGLCEMCYSSLSSFVRFQESLVWRCTNQRCF